MKSINDISADVLDQSIRIHKALGPGLLEKVYETVLMASLIRLGYRVDRQVPVDIEFDEMRFEAAFKVDLLVDQRLVLEIKSVEQFNNAHTKQLLTYLRLLKQPVGLLLNFSRATMMEGFHRVANDYREPG